MQLSVSCWTLYFVPLRHRYSAEYLSPRTAAGYSDSVSVGCLKFGIVVKDVRTQEYAGQQFSAVPSPL